MKLVRSDKQMKTQLAKEFEQLVLNIIYIEEKTKCAFGGTNTILVKDFIQSLIKSTDVTSDIPTELRTQSLKIIRKVVESENKNMDTSASQWETNDWLAYKS